MGLGSLLDALKVWAESVISTMGYAGLGLIMFLENVFPPIPSEVVLPLAGSLTLTGRYSMVWVTIVGMIGSVLGALFFYGLGKLLGEERTRTLFRNYGKWAFLSVEDFDTAKAWFDRYDELVIFFGRMVPVVRSLISIPAGISSMNLGRFCFYTAIGTALWSFLLAFAGRLLGASWPLVADWMNTYQNVVLALCAVLVLLFVANRIYRRRKRS
jgi:membrane protein DedA with SNARE-associated domain